MFRILGDFQAIRLDSLKLIFLWATLSSSSHSALKDKVISFSDGLFPKSHWMKWTKESKHWNEQLHNPFLGCTHTAWTMGRDEEESSKLSYQSAYQSLCPCVYLVTSKLTSYCGLESKKFEDPASSVEVLPNQRKLPRDQTSRTSHPLQACIIRQRDRAGERIEGMALDTISNWGASQSQHTLQGGKALPQKMMHLESRDGIGPEYLVRNGAQRREIRGQSGKGSQPQWAVTSDNQATIWPSLTRLNQSNKDSTSCNIDWNAKPINTLYGWHPRTNHSTHE